MSLVRSLEWVQLIRKELHHLGSFMSGQ